MITNSIKFFLTVGALFSVLLSPANNNEVLFISPLKIPLRLAGNFGEIRSSHLHTGIDIKTNRSEGYPVYSVERGYISRISVSPFGYGRVLYVTHPNGYISVYAHLQRFHPEVEDYIDSVQYAKQSFSVNIYLSPSQFPLEKGAHIAYSGNTGSSHAPHLHFELRTLENKPVNPLHFNFQIADTIPPRIYKAVLYPDANKGTVSGTNRPIHLPLRVLNKNHYTLKKGVVPRVSGTIYFGIQTFDFLNDSRNKCGIYKQEVRVNGELIYAFKLDTLDFSERSFFKGFLDYQRLVENKEYVYQSKTYQSKNLSVLLNKKGVYTFTEYGEYEVSIDVWDVYQNHSNLTYKVLSVEQPELPSQKHNVLSNKKNILETNSFNLTIEKRDILESFYLEYEEKTVDDSLRPVLIVGNPSIPVLQEINLSAKIHNISAAHYLQLGIFCLSSKTFYPATVRNGYANANVESFGKYQLVVDSVPPTIKLIRSFKHSNTIKFSVADGLSGVSSYTAYIDNKWAKFEQNSNNILSYTFDKKRLASNQNHTLKLIVFDEANNATEYNYTFYK